MASTYNSAKTSGSKKSKIDYDRNLLSAEDYDKLQGYQQDYINATTDAERRQAHQNAERLRASYGYSMGASGDDFTALGALEGTSDQTNYELLMLQNGPQWQQDWDAQLEDLRNQQAGRGPFSYDPQTDETYQAAALQAQLQGQQAMRGAMAEAAALTGGYGSTYAQNVAQQAYQGSLDELAAQLPEYYQMALQSYQQAGQALEDQISQVQQLQQQDYDRYLDQVEYWTNQARQENDDYWDQASFAQNSANAASTAQRTAWDQAMDSINLGVVPSSSVLAAAGIPLSWAQSMAASARWRIYN